MSLTLPLLGFKRWDMDTSLAHSDDKVKLDPSWKKALQEEFTKPYMNELRKFLAEQIKMKKPIFPKGTEYFTALNKTPLDKVKVVILGQDPYHGPGQAHGLSFSVPKGVPQPPSLKNIFKELKTDVNVTPPKHGNLISWAEQGVLLLNSVLTVESGLAASHKGRGWETFTDRIIAVLNEQPRPIVFILWGAYAQAKGQFIDRKKHFVIESPHPSPLSATRGFFGSKPFSKANQFLASKKLTPIQWEIADDVH